MAAQQHQGHQGALTPINGYIGGIGMQLGHHNAYAHAATNQQIMAAYALQQQHVSHKTQKILKINFGIVTPCPEF